MDYNDNMSFVYYVYIDVNVIKLILRLILQHLFLQHNNPAWCCMMSCFSHSGWDQGAEAEESQTQGLCWLYLSGVSPQCV